MFLNKNDIPDSQQSRGQNTDPQIIEEQDVVGINQDIVENIINFDDVDSGSDAPQEIPTSPVKSKNKRSNSSNSDGNVSQKSQKSQKSRQEFVEEQKQQIAQKQKIYFDSPTRFQRNSTFFKYHPEEQDFSLFANGNDTPNKFTYQIEAKQTNIEKSNNEEEQKEFNSMARISNQILQMQELEELDQFQDNHQKPEEIQVYSPQQETPIILDTPIQPNIDQLDSHKEEENINTSMHYDIKRNRLKKSKGEAIIWQCKEIPDVRQFLNTPVPKGYVIQCLIRRDTSGMGMLYPKYHLYTTHKDIYLVTCRKLGMQKTSKYNFSLSKTEYSSKVGSYLAKLRSNFLGTEYMLYDNGKSPELLQDPTQLRSQLCLIYYENQMLQTRAPRKIKVMIPPVDERTNTPLQIKPTDPKGGLLQSVQNEELRDVSFHEFVNKQPQWNAKLQGFVLDFTNRVIKASIKNFQLLQIEGTNEIDQKNVILQFGKYGSQDFNLDLKYPFTPLQAFAICVSNFDSKLACE